MIIFQFNADSDLSRWSIVDDVVMGGRSNGKFKISSDGYGKFYGEVSLENNGGFSSVRCQVNSIKATNYKNFRLRIKGDGKIYQFRVKNGEDNRHSYIYSFTTTNDWQDIIIPFNQMTPSFRGNQLNMSNYNGDLITEIAFLIGNKKAETFKLLIEKIAIF